MMKLFELIINRKQGSGNKQTTTSLRDAPLPQAGRKQSRERAKKESVILSEPVGRNAPQLRTPPITEMSLGRPVVILNEVKDLGDGVAKERFFAHEAQNDKTPTPHTLSPERAKKGRGTLFVILSETKDLGDGVAKERFFAHEAQNDKTPTPHPLLPQAGRKQSQERARSGFVILNEVTRSVLCKDLGDGMAKERFSAHEVYCVKEAQNDKTPTPPTPSREGARSGVRGSRVQPRNPAYENNQNDKKPTPHPPLPQAGRKQSQERVKKGCVTLTRACGVANFQHRWFMNEDPHPRSLRSRNQPLAGLRLPQKREGLKTAPFRMTFVVVCLLLLLVLVSPVAAQVPTTRLFVNPTPLLIDTTISPTGVVTLEVADGVDIFAFDLFVQYDPSLLWVSQVSLGDFLGGGLFCMDQINNPGLVHYNCTRWGVDTGVSGSGVLLTLTFEALGKGGDTLLSLEGSQLYDWPDAQPVDLSLEDGAVSVRPFSTYLPLILTASGQGLELMP